MAKAEEIFGLESNLSVAVGANRILSARLAEMCAMRERALDWSDIEGVHDMRVASRRLRSAVRDFLPSLPRARRLRRWAGDLRELAATLGEVRDQDVALAALGGLAEKTPDEKTLAGLQVFIAERETRRETARAALVEAVAEERLAVLQARFVLAFDRSLQAAKPDAPTLRQAGERIIAAGWRDFARLSRSLYKPFRVEPLHRLRIAAKRLRYALELFAPFWPPETLTPLAAQVAQMQGALGDLHDCDVWLEDCGARLAASAADTAERHAAVWLMRHFVKDRTNSYREALAVWRDWETTGFGQTLTGVLQGAEENL
jgi:CHAD domain-containing protein